MRKQHYMTPDERQKLEALHRARIPVAQIAAQLGFCRQTIYNELRRGAYAHACDYCDEIRYSPEKAQQLRDYAQTGKGRPLKIGKDHCYAQFLEDKMLGRLPDGTIDKRRRYAPGPALAAARAAGFTTTVCETTLYNYIDKGVFLHLTNKDLWQKRKRHKQGHRPVQRIAHPKLPSITDRPEHINQRQDMGHWEWDLVVSCAGSRAVLLTMTERVSRQELIFKLPDKRAATVCSVLDQLERRTKGFQQRFQSITSDNGSEFVEYDKLCRSVHGGKRLDMYYCHSYAAWEKGSCENHNRMIRRWFPKGTDFARVEEQDVQLAQEWMNHYPRKALGWCCPADFK